eukprot:2083472-Pyramimonas_sp.AAC.1
MKSIGRVVYRGMPIPRRRRTNRRHCPRDRARRGSEYGLTGSCRRKLSNSPVSRSIRSPQPPGKRRPCWSTRSPTNGAAE